MWSEYRIVRSPGEAGLTNATGEAQDRNGTAVRK